jgi:hypothetical protein
MRQRTGSKTSPGRSWNVTSSPAASTMLICSETISPDFSAESMRTTM